MQAELAASQDAVSGAEKSKANYERQLRDMQGRLEEAEAAGGKNLKNQIRKLEQRVSIKSKCCVDLFDVNLWLNNSISAYFKSD